MKFALKSTKSSSPNKTRAKSPKKKDEKFSTFTLKSTPSYRFEDGLLIEDDDIDPFNKQPSTSMNTTSSSHHESSDDNQDNKNGDVKKNDTIVMQPNPVQLVPKTVRESVMVVNGKDGCKLNDKGECLQPGNLSTCKHSLYNHPLPKEQLMDIFGFQQQNGKEVDDGSNHDSNKNLLLTEGGLIWKASILPNGYDTNYESKKTLKMLPLKFYDDKNKCIKPRRPTLAVVEKDFFDSLVKIEGINYTGSSVSGNRDSSTTTTKQEEFNFLGSIARQITVLKDEEHNIVWDQHKHHSKWIFSGVLNGWPGLKDLEVKKIEYKTHIPKWRVHWHSGDNPNDSPPTYPHAVMGLQEVRAVLRAPGWTAQGWSQDSPGYVYWYTGPDIRDVPRLVFGTNIIKDFEKERYENSKNGMLSLLNPQSVEPSPKCVRVHMISHRYSLLEENLKDRVTYHSFALLEWDHGKHCTVIELAYFNGLGGYNARCNHVEDRDAPVTTLFKTFPPEMVQPWKDTLSEIRCIDVKAKSVEEYLKYMEKYTGKDKRFLDVQHTFNHAVRLSFCSKEEIARYLINYIRRGKTYSEIRKNCQTFAADFCAFLAGKKDVQPFHKLNNVAYRNQTHYFMYESTMYEKH